MNHKAPSTAGKIAAVRAVHTMRPELAHLVRLASSRVDGAGGARTVKITVADYQKAAGFDLADAAEAVQALIRRQISAGGEGRSEINWLEKYELYDSGRASLVFSIQAIPYLHALKIHFEEHPTSDTDGVRSLYARRLIEWFDLHAVKRARRSHLRNCATCSISRRHIQPQLCDNGRWIPPSKSWRPEGGP